MGCLSVFITDLTYLMVKDGWRDRLKLLMKRGSSFVLRVSTKSTILG
jgi:hypothetical protein